MARARWECSRAGPYSPWSRSRELRRFRLAASSGWPSGKRSPGKGAWGVSHWHAALGVLAFRPVLPLVMQQGAQVTQGGGQVGVALGEAVPREEGLEHGQGLLVVLACRAVLPLRLQQGAQVVVAGG